ncbi:helix-turn-helix domain-containing protein [Heyndrickxia sp. NPDC080065]|uniref:helix-turn-helix domain-containing protein n=1 Tax=Heyndrickxia sp. NPDC080065 TaxID=3390568 RepID=UPI003D0078E3
MIGTRIYELRKQRGLTLSELAERAGISKSYLSNMERNLNQNPSIQVMSKIASVLKVELITLLTSDTQAEPLEKEWLDLVMELKESGVDKDQIQEYKTLIEFIKWKNAN